MIDKLHLFGRASNVQELKYFILLIFDWVIEVQLLYFSICFFEILFLLTESFLLQFKLLYSFKLIFQLFELLELGENIKGVQLAIEDPFIIF